MRQLTAMQDRVSVAKISEWLMSREGESRSSWLWLYSYIGTSERKGDNTPVRGPSGGQDEAIVDDRNRLLAKGSGGNVTDVNTRSY